MAKISHESPICLFQESLNYNDYDYALVHLFEQNKTYYDFFENSIKSGRSVILDTSQFELGTNFDPEKYIFWINKLKPTYYIIPDVVDDAEKNIKSLYEWLEKYQHRVAYAATAIAVVHGSNYEDYKKSYIEANKNASFLAFNHASSCFTNETDKTDLPKEILRAEGRFLTISKLEKDGILNQNKRHHLLGANLPQEIMFYRNKDYIYSIDTSNPVIHGIFGERYSEHGLHHKNNQLLADYIDVKLTHKQKTDILYNIKKFREFSM